MSHMCTAKFFVVALRFLRMLAADEAGFITVTHARCVKESAAKVSPHLSYMYGFGMVLTKVVENGHT